VPATASFVLTVKAAVTFKSKNVQNAPPPSGTTFKAGSVIPMKWTYLGGSTPVASADVGHTVTVVGPLPGGPIRTFTNTDPGDSGFRYSSSTKTWTFNLQTKDAHWKPFPVGTYEVTISPTTPGYASSPTFQIRLK
jgi:hypothetical protein